MSCRPFCLWRLLCGLLLAASTAVAQQPTLTRPGKSLPPVSRPVMFDTPEADAIVSALQIFPADNPWNADISGWPLHPDSQALVESIGPKKPLRGNTDMAYILVPKHQKKVPLAVVSYPDESDPGPFPIPDNIPIEGWPASYRRDRSDQKWTLQDVQRDTAREGGDRHGIVVDLGTGLLHEFYQLKRTDRGWEAACAATFDLTSNRLRPDGWTSSDAAGLPIFPAIVRYDELRAGEITHALRFTIVNSRRAYVAPATHFASQKTDRNLPRMGERFRLKSDYDITPFSREAQVILRALKKHGMLVADNGIDWAISIAPDERIPVLHEELRKVKGEAFEVVLAPGMAP